MNSKIVKVLILVVLIIVATVVMVKACSTSRTMQSQVSTPQVAPQSLELPSETETISNMEAAAVGAIAGSVVGGLVANQRNKTTPQTTTNNTYIVKQKTDKPKAVKTKPTPVKKTISKPKPKKVSLSKSSKTRRK